MGHEIAHALREHARERMGKTAATKMGANLISSLLGLGSAGDALLNMGGQLLTLRFSREDESEADLIGMELAARAGYDPRAGVSLWQKMGPHPRGSAAVAVDAPLGHVAHSGHPGQPASGDAAVRPGRAPAAPV